MSDSPYRSPTGQSLDGYDQDSAGGLTAEDASHLKLLTIFHYIIGGIGMLTSLIPVVHLVVGVLMVRGALPGGAGPGPPPEIGWLVIAFASFVILVGLSLATLTVFVGQQIASRQRHMVCLVNAGIQCLFVPLGTALGVFTFIVLLWPRVQAVFQRNRG